MKMYILYRHSNNRNKHSKLENMQKKQKYKRTDDKNHLAKPKKEQNLYKILYKTNR